MTEAHGAVRFLYLHLSYKVVDHERGLVKTQVSPGFFLRTAGAQYWRENCGTHHMRKTSDYRGQWSIGTGALSGPA